MNIRDPDIFRNIKPEESQGFASVQQLRMAKDNVNASLSGQPIPHQPQPTDDAGAHLEIYGEVREILAKANQQSQQLEQLIQIYTALLANKQSETAKTGNKPRMGKPTMNLMGGGSGQRTGPKIGAYK
jgi:hypothetical protein